MAQTLKVELLWPDFSKRNSLRERFWFFWVLVLFFWFVFIFFK